MRIVIAPKKEWAEIAREESSFDVLIRHYIVPLSLLAPVSSMIGMKVFDATWDEGSGYHVPPQEIFAAAAITLFASIASVFVLAAIFVLIAPMFDSARDYRAALKVATFGAVPVLLAGATLFIPVMAVVGVLALVHSLYLFWLGAREVLHVRHSQQAEFVGISILLLCVASTLLGGAASALGLL